MRKQMLINNGRNFINRIYGIRFFTFLLMLIFFMDKYTSGFRMDVGLLGESCSPVVLPFLQTSGYYMKLVLLNVVYFYTNVPFMEKEELFYIMRLGKKRWGRRNLFYLFCSSLFLTLCFFLISCIQAAPVGAISFSWGSVYKTLALTGGQNLFFQIPYPIIKAYTPALLMTIIFLLDWLAVLFLGLLMYMISLCGFRILASITAILVVFLPSANRWLGGILLYYSPLDWLDCTKWRIGYDNSRPDLPYIFTTLIFLNLLLLLASQHLVQKMEWKSQED